MNKTHDGRKNNGGKPGRKCRAWVSGPKSKMKENALRNLHGYEGKLALVETYEKMGLVPPVGLRERVRMKRAQLINRGVEV